MAFVIGLSKKIPHGWKQRDPHKKADPIYFQESHVSVLAAEPRVLIIRLKHACLEMPLFLRYVRHTQDMLIPKSKNGGSMCLHLCPQNTMTGHASFCVTPMLDWEVWPRNKWAATRLETETTKSEFFRTFLSEQGLWLPSTFEEYQKGPGGTWRHTNGNWLRGDYVGIPVQWAFTTCQAFVSEDIDVSTVKEDHRAAVVQVQGPCQEHRLQPKPRRQILRDENVASIDSFAFQFIQKPDITVDVHTHSHLLQERIVQQFGSSSQQPGKKPRKEGMTGPLLGNLYVTSGTGGTIFGSHRICRGKRFCSYVSKGCVIRPRNAKLPRSQGS